MSSKVWQIGVADRDGTPRWCWGVWEFDGNRDHPAYAEPIALCRDSVTANRIVDALNEKEARAETFERIHYGAASTGDFGRTDDER